ncbi:hypothetical protein B0X71_15120 [Planococcus lenghuensis]|uniref:Uncharacterized protein n=1 Tax=Planococcus lenghuensis TaxID=2213202 RepID=A0A1Q2L2K4_9BACL|nr:hypothetical protein B0X71_15120 [Planococcus lenghuensis]
MSCERLDRHKATHRGNPDFRRAVTYDPESLSAETGQRKSGVSRERPIADWNGRPGNLFPAEGVKSAYGLANELDNEKS